jgi:hypothetical protein
LEIERLRRVLSDEGLQRGRDFDVGVNGALRDRIGDIGGRVSGPSLEGTPSFASSARSCSNKTMNGPSSVPVT